MEPGPTRGQRASHRRVGPDRPEQLDERGPDREQHLVDPLILDPFPEDGFDPQHRAVALDGPLQILDRDTDVIDVHEMDRHASPSRSPATDHRLETLSVFPAAVAGGPEVWTSGPPSEPKVR